MKGKPTVTQPSNELQSVEEMLRLASEYGLEAEVVTALCAIVKAHPDVALEEATFQALAEWDL